MGLETLKQYLSPMPEKDRERFARRCGSSIGHLRNVISGFRPCATDLAVSIETESQRAVRRWDLRPADWHRHWPELKEDPAAPRVPRERGRKKEAV